MWLGSSVFLIAVAAPAAFKASPDATIAASVVGAMLTRWHYLAIAAPLLLFALEWRRNRPIVVSLLFAALTFAAAQGMVDLRIRAIRESVMFGIGGLDPSDPLRREFGMLHGISMLLMAAQVLFAAIVVAMNARKTAYVDDAVALVRTPAYAPPAAPSAAPMAASVVDDTHGVGTPQVVSGVTADDAPPAALDIHEDAAPEVVSDLGHDDTERR